MKREERYFAAMKARDKRFDGKFFVGVKTTGIYCRPICPARPKRENVEFFDSKAAAVRSGYRPCLRCRPETVPHTGAWLGKSAMVQRALKLINQENALQFNENDFAEKFGVTARHLRRVFVAELGATPKQLSFERRLLRAQKMIVETTRPMTEVAFIVGFGSVRRFNDAFKNRFKKSPSMLRQRGRK